MAEFNVRIVKAFTPKEDPMAGPFTNQTPWTDDLRAIREEAVTASDLLVEILDLLDERLPSNPGAANAPESDDRDDERAAKGEPECDCGAADGYHGTDCPRAVAKPQPDPDTYDEVERLLAANRDLIARAEAAEAERDEWEAAAVAARTQQRAAFAERDEWRSKFEQTDNLLSRTRDERDEAEAERDRATSLRITTADHLGRRVERAEARHAALRNDVAACRNACQIEGILARDDERGW